MPKLITARSRVCLHPYNRPSRKPEFSLLACLVDSGLISDVAKIVIDYYEEDLQFDTTVSDVIFEHKNSTAKVGDLSHWVTLCTSQRLEPSGVHRIEFCFPQRVPSVIVGLSPAPQTSDSPIFGRQLIGFHDASSKTPKASGLGVCSDGTTRVNSVKSHVAGLTAWTSNAALSVTLIVDFDADVVQFRVGRGRPITVFSRAGLRASGHLCAGVSIGDPCQVSVGYCMDA